MRSFHVRMSQENGFPGMKWLHMGRLLTVYGIHVTLHLWILSFLLSLTPIAGPLQQTTKWATYVSYNSYVILHKQAQVEHGCIMILSALWFLFWVTILIYYISKLNKLELAYIMILGALLFLFFGLQFLCHIT